MLDFGIINLSQKEMEGFIMPKENIFSGKYEPDRDTCTEANESSPFSKTTIEPTDSIPLVLEIS